MAYPTLTTCTKCGKPATLSRREEAVQKRENPETPEAEETKLGYLYSVCCPHCGFRFRSWPKR